MTWNSMPGIASRFKHDLEVSVGFLLIHIGNHRTVLEVELVSFQDNKTWFVFDCELDSETPDLSNLNAGEVDYCCEILLFHNFGRCRRLLRPPTRLTNCPRCRTASTALCCLHLRLISHRIAARDQVGHEPLLREQREEASRPSSQNVWNFSWDFTLGISVGIGITVGNSRIRLTVSGNIIYIKTFCSG